MAQCLRQMICVLPDHMHIPAALAQRPCCTIFYDGLTVPLHGVDKRKGNRCKHMANGSLHVTHLHGELPRDETGE